MLTLGICVSVLGEQKKIIEECKKRVAINSDERIQFVISNQIESFSTEISSHDILNVVFLDITLEGSYEFAEMLRKKYENVVLVIITDLTVSPIKFIKPSIMVASLMMRPFDDEQVENQIDEIIYGLIEPDNQSDENFSIEYKGEKISVPFKEIYYFESRDKKIFLGMENSEYGFYDTMKSLEDKLPKEFVRCGQSYIFNKTKLRKILLNDSMVELYSGIRLPISRRYKKLMKEL